ncbi:MAG: recombinase RecA [Proteobacteria bacterium]|jgi:recombination protein RecA|nr:recombinase RecA [Pseudomonadota bacterium]
MKKSKQDPKQDRDRAIEAAIATIERAYGKGAIMRYGDSDIPSIAAISTGSISIDAALGIGGVPKGRVIEIYGQESSGKTTLALQIVSEAMREGGTAAFIDAEHALDVNYARALGVNVEELLISQPDHGEQALEIAETLVRSGAISVVVIDSVAALVPKSELEGDMGDAQVGAQARLMSQALRKLTGAIHKSDTVVIFINQIRQKIGVMFGSPNTTSGGKALKFYASVRMEVIRIGSIKARDEVLGNRTRCKIVKNKVAPPFRQVEFDIRYGKGICRASEILELGDECGLVRKSGSWYSIGDERIGQGKENARTFLLEHPALMERVRIEILRHKGLLPPEEGTNATGGVIPQAK